MSRAMNVCFFRQLPVSRVRNNFQESRIPTVVTRERSAAVIQVTFLLDGMRAPRRGISGIFRPGCSGQFVGDSGSMESATLVEMLGNGTLEVTLKEQ